MITSRLRPFGTTIFSEMTKLALQHGAINLAQGFPDFDGPPAVADAAVAAIRAGENQYARSMGHPKLVTAVASRVSRLYGLSYDPMSEVSVFSGATEGIAATLLGLLEPGDEVVVFEPFYDSYPAVAALAGATIRPYTLRFPAFSIDEAELAKCFSEKTRLVILNTPHNPTGKVFTPAELAIIARLCVQHDCVAMCDEVYEHLTYEAATHVPLATLPGMRDRTITLSSSGKTWSFTGWKIGWATGPKPLIAAAQAAHQFLTFATSTPMQVAVSTAMAPEADDYYAVLRREYSERRAFLLEVLAECGFRCAAPEGSYFVLADFTKLHAGDDRAFVTHLVEKAGVAAIPPTPFYNADPGEGRRLARFAFCKKPQTLDEAAARLRKWAKAGA